MELKTKRCTIRPFEEKDLDAFTAYRNDMGWMAYQGFKGRTRKEYAAALLPAPRFEDGAQLAIAANGSDALIGDLYLKQEGDVFWVGYTIAPAHARQGYAAEAVGAAIDWLRGQGAKQVNGGVLAENAASIALLKKLGFAYSHYDEAGEEDVYILKL